MNSGALWYRQSADDRWTRHKRIQRAAHLWIVLYAHQIARAVEAN